MAAPFDPKKLKEVEDALKKGGKDAAVIVEQFKKFGFELERTSARTNAWGKNLGETLQTISETNDRQKMLSDGLSKMTQQQQQMYAAVSKINDQSSISQKINNELGVAAINLQNSLEEIAIRNSKILDLENKIKDVSEQEKKVIQEQINLLNKEISQLQTLTATENKRLSQLKIQSGLLKGKEFIFRELSIPTSFLDMIQQTYERFKEIDKVTTQVRQQFGLFRHEAEDLEKSIRETAIDMAHLGATATDVAGTVSTLGKNFTYISGRNTALVKDVVALNKQFGISAETSAKFLKTMGGVTGKSAESKTNMLSMAGAAAKAYGVGLEDVMNEVADASDDVRMYAGKNADEMIRAAAQARQMGTSLSNMAATAKGLLNFESSIQNELKASALIGKNINFNEARRLAFQGKVVEANKVILDQAKKIKFNQLNPLAQEAFAQAAGKSVKELQDMMEAETRIKDALNSQDPVVKKLAQEKLKEQKTLKDNAKLAQQRFEEDLKTKANQERLTVLQNKISQQLQKLMLPTLEAITKLADLLVAAFDKFKPEELIGPLVKVRLIFGMMLGQGTQFAKSLVSLGFNVLLAPLRAIGGILKNLLSGPLNKLSATLEGGGKISQFLSKSFKAIGDAFGWVSNVINKFKSFGKSFDDARKAGTGFFKSIFQAAETTGGTFARISKSITNFFKPLTTFVGKIVTPIVEAFNPIRASLSAVFGAGAKLPGLFQPILKLSKLGLKGVPLLGEVIMAIEFIMNLWKRFSEIWSDNNLNIGQKVLKSVIAVPKAIYDVLVQPFIDIGKWIVRAVFGEKILNGIVSVTEKIWYLVKWPFQKAYDWIMEMLGGKSPSKIGLAIWNGIKSIGTMMLDAILSPFKNAYQSIKILFNSDVLSFILNSLKSFGLLILESFISPFKLGLSILSKVFNFAEILIPIVKTGLNFIPSLFTGAFSFLGSFFTERLISPFKTAIELIKPIITEIGTFFGNVFINAFEYVKKGLELVWEKIKGIGGFVMDVVGKGISLVANVFGGGGETTSTGKSTGKTEPVKNELVDAIVNSNRLVVERLDKLTQLMTSGQIAVYIDGQRANQLLASSTTKFGSLGQATTF